MPKIYLSPSTQEYNPYVTGNGSEEYFMNLVADAMEPYLLANGIQFSRNTPDMTAASSIRQANRGDYDFYLALHSNASGPGSEGQNRGIIAFYYPTSRNGRRGAEIIARNLQEIYPLPERVVTRSTTSLGEVRQPRAPAVLVEIGYHDNREDADWIRNNLTAIAVNLTQSLCDYFGIPLIEAGPVFRGTVVTDGSNLNLRQFPSTQGAIIGTIPNGSVLTVYSRSNGWDVVSYQGMVGYASSEFITI